MSVFALLYSMLNRLSQLYTFFTVEVTHLNLLFFNQTKTDETRFDYENNSDGFSTRPDGKLPDDI